MSVTPLRKVLLLVLALSLGGCLSKSLPDPNDPASGQITPVALQSDLLGVTNLLGKRLGKKEITEAEFKQRVIQGAHELIERANLPGVEDEDAWRFAEVLRAAQMWKEADPVLRQAVAWAKKVHSNDRLVNDSLRLAQVLAQENKVPEAIETARSVFTVPATDAAPILIAVYLEVAPAAIGKSHDLEVAKMIIDAAKIYVKVDPASPEGKAFLGAREHHVSKALEQALQIYDHANKHAEGIEAIKNAYGKEST